MESSLSVLRPEQEASSRLLLQRSPNDFLVGSQFRSQFDLENEVIFRPEHDPDKPGGREPGDVYIVIGMILGAIVGGIAGTALAAYGNSGNVFINLSFGAVAGGIAGTLIGDWLKKRVSKKRRRGELPKKGLQ